VNRALVLSGGGSKGSFQLGVIDQLVARSLDFQVIAGVSTGALTAVMLAQGKGPTGLGAQLLRLNALYMGLRGNGDVYRKRFGGLASLLWGNALYDPKPIAEKLKRAVNLLSLASSGVELRLGTVCLESGQYRVVTQKDPNVVSFAMASASMPVFFPPVGVSEAGKIKHWVDGGVRHVTPLGATFEALASLPQTGDAQGADTVPDEMYVVLCDPLPAYGNDPSTFKTGLPVLERAIDLLSNQVLLDDLAYAAAVNDAAKAGTPIPLASGRKGRYVKLVAYAPSVTYSDTLEFDPRKIRAAINGGRVSEPLDQAAFVKLVEATQ
jgi:NTE family protein